MRVAPAAGAVVVFLDWAVANGAQMVLANAKDAPSTAYRPDLPIATKNGADRMIRFMCFPFTDSNVLLANVVLAMISAFAPCIRAGGGPPGRQQGY